MDMSISICLVLQKQHCTADGNTASLRVWRALVPWDKRELHYFHGQNRTKPKRLGKGEAQSTDLCLG